MDTLLGLLLTAIFYFLPIILGRKKRRAMALFWLNLLGGWTGLGWLIAFIWALTKDAAASQASPIPLPTVSSNSRPAVTRTTNSSVSAPSFTPQPIALVSAAPNLPVQSATRVIAQELERLFQLKERGGLTNEEYLDAKIKLLA